MPYHPSQKIRVGKDGFLNVTMNVEINFTFMQWVCGHQECLEVLGPDKVRSGSPNTGSFSRSTIVRSPKIQDKRDRFLSSDNSRKRILEISPTATAALSRNIFA